MCTAVRQVGISADQRLTALAALVNGNIVAAIIDIKIITEVVIADITAHVLLTAIAIKRRQR